MLKYLGAETKIMPNTTPFGELDVDALVLSGGAARVETDTMKLGRTGEYLDKADFPIFGMCLSHQFMALYYGGKSGPAPRPEFGRAELIVDRDFDLFMGLPKRFIVWESHNDEIKVLPDCFESYAHSENCMNQAIKHRERPIYGVQFHPEVEHTEHGYDIFKNFLRVVKARKNQ